MSKMMLALSLLLLLPGCLQESTGQGQGGAQPSGTDTTTTTTTTEESCLGCRAVAGTIGWPMPEEVYSSYNICDGVLELLEEIGTCECASCGICPFCTGSSLPPTSPDCQNCITAVTTDDGPCVDASQACSEDFRYTY